jgi:hypothetical protein
MVFDVRPVIVLVKAPDPVPSEVILLVTMGVEDVLQHTPRAVTPVPPSSEMIPPETAEVFVMDTTAFVVRVGTGLGVEKMVSLP